MILEDFNRNTRKHRTAEDWFVLNQNPDMSEQECLDFLAWLESDPANEQAYAEIETVSSLMAAAAADSSTRSSRQTSFGTKMAALMTVAACAVFGIVLVLLSPQDDIEYYATAVGEQRVVTLEDGSIIRLNTNSSAEVAFDTSQRRIALKRGEAYFDVRKDPTGRPFIVETIDGGVRAIGTEFNIRIYPNSTTVSVLEGIVELFEIDSAAETQPLRPRLEEGFEAIVTRSGITDISKTPISSNVSSWTDGWSDFSGTPLSSVVEEVNRYSRTQIVIADKALESLSMEARFMIGDPDQLVEAIAAVYPVRVVRRPGQIVLYEQSSAAVSD